MKTIRITRTIRRKLPKDWFVSIGPEGLSFHRKRKKEAYMLYWDEAIERSMLFGAAREAQKPLPLAVEGHPTNPRQVPMFTEEEILGGTGADIVCLLDAKLATDQHGHGPKEDEEN